MNKNSQPKNSGPRGRDKQAIAAVIEAIEDCLAKASYDYQRIIVCRTNRPELGRRLRRLADSRRGVIAVAFGAEERGRDEALESVVSFVNRSRKVVVLVAGERCLKLRYDEWSNEAAQIRRRTHVVFEF